MTKVVRAVRRFTKGLATIGMTLALLVGASLMVGLVALPVSGVNASTLSFSSPGTQPGNGDRRAAVVGQCVRGHHHRPGGQRSLLRRRGPLDRHRLNSQGLVFSMLTWISLDGSTASEGIGPDGCGSFSWYC